MTSNKKKNTPLDDSAQRDEINAQRALKLAWRRALPPDDADTTLSAETPEVAAEPTDPQGPIDSPEKERQFHAWATLECERLAGGIERTWVMSRPEQQRQATAQLIAHAASLGLALVQMFRHPLASVRLFRLAARHYPRLDAALVHEIGGIALWADFSHPEVGELVLELIRAKRTRLSDSLHFTFEAHLADTHWPSGLAESVCALFEDQAQGAVRRRLALDWLGVIRSPAAVPTLRRALQATHIHTRAPALAILCAMEPCPLEPEDVHFLLRDALAHPLPEWDYSLRQILDDFADQLAQVTVALHPHGGDELLRDLATGNGRPYEWPRKYLNEAWALRTLAAAYPQTAEPLIDAWFADGASAVRLQAVEAAAKLPPAQAAPRLCRAAADGALQVAERARALWEKHFTAPCPVAELAGLETALLVGPPSEQLRSRLAVLRGPSQPARAAMLEVLFDEAPDPEALVLLLWVAADEDLVRHPGRPRLPEGHPAFVRLLLERFGTPAVAGLCRLALRERHGYFAWVWALRDLVRDHLLDPAGHAVLQQSAAQLVLQLDDGDDAYAALCLLQTVGGPVEVAPQVWKFLEDPYLSESARSVAAQALAKLAPEAALDAQIAAALERALDTREWTRVEWLATTSGLRPVPAACDLLAQVLAHADDFAGDDPLLIHLGQCLADAGRIDAVWVLGALNDPESRRFAVAVRLFRFARTQEAELLTRLKEALSSTARVGSAAAEAATALLWLDSDNEHVALDDPRWLQLCQQAPLRKRAELVTDLIVKGAALEPFWPMLREILVSGCPGLADLIGGSLYRLPEPYRQDVVKLLDAIADEPLCDLLRTLTRTPHPALDYWADEEEEETAKEGEEENEGEHDEEEDT